MSKIWRSTISGGGKQRHFDPTEIVLCRGHENVDELGEEAHLFSVVIVAHGLWVHRPGVGNEQQIYHARLTVQQWEVVRLSSDD